MTRNQTSQVLQRREREPEAPKLPATVWSASDEFMADPHTPEEIELASRMAAKRQETK